MKHLIILDPSNFPKRAELSFLTGSIRAFFGKRYPGDFVVHNSRYPRDSIRVIKRFAEEADGEIVRVYCLGGHNLFYDCVNGAVGLPNVQLAAMPYGAPNYFTRIFGGNNDERFKDFEEQTKSPIIPTDLIHACGRYGLGYCAIGANADIIMKYRGLNKKFPRLAKILGPNNLYVLSIPLSLMRKRIPDRACEITIDGKSFDGDYAGIFIANIGEYLADRVPAPMAHPADGILEIMLIKNTGRLKRISLLRGFLKGHYKKWPKDITHLRGQEVVVTSNFGTMRVLVDGEISYTSKADIKIFPKAVQIAVPNGLDYVVREKLP